MLVNRVPLLQERATKPRLDCVDLPRGLALLDDLDAFPTAEASVLRRGQVGPKV